MENKTTVLLGVSAFFLLLLISQTGCKENELDNTQLPMLSTLAIQEVSSQSANSGGEITSDGDAPVTARGLVWNTSENPTIEINEGMTTDGEGVGTFTSALTNLSPYSIYYARAYAVNSKGTNYGNQIEFETLPEGAYGTVTDADGNVYWTVAIGDIEWMAQNLRTTKNADGTPIPTGLSDEEWANTNEAAYRIIPYEDTIEGNRFVEVLLDFDSYGFLYNGYVATEGNPCPEGWHVSTAHEWDISMEFLSLMLGLNDNTVGDALKSCRQVNSPLGGGCKTNWHPRWNESSKAHGLNKLLFIALPAGFIDYHGLYSGLGENAMWWTSTPNQGNYTQVRYLSYNNSRYSKITGSNKLGYSIRCVRPLEIK